MNSESEPTTESMTEQEIHDMFEAKTKEILFGFNDAMLALEEEIKKEKSV